MRYVCNGGATLIFTKLLVNIRTTLACARLALPISPWATPTRYMRSKQ